MLPHKVKYSDKVKGGTSKLFFVEINKVFKEDKGLHAHEYEHVKQWYMGLAAGLSVAFLIFMLGMVNLAIIVAIMSIWVKGLLYTFIKPARQWMEVQAFKKQIKLSPSGTINFAAERLCKDYGLNLTRTKALKLLKGG